MSLTEKVLAYDGIAVVVHPSNTVTDLTVEQVQKIYKGEITNWSEVGGEDAEIAVVSREDGSGTRGAFEEIVDFEDALTAGALIKDGNGNVQATVAETPLAIGYVSFTYLDDTIKGLKIEGVEPTVEKRAQHHLQSIKTLHDNLPRRKPFGRCQSIPHMD